MQTIESAMATAVLVAVGVPAHRAITPARGDIKWCGPSAVSSVTGCTSELARLLIAVHRYGREAPQRARYVRGSTVPELEYALRALGWSAQPVSSGCETLARFLDWSAGEESAFVVLAARHYIVSQRAYVADRLVDRGLCGADESQKRRAIVRRYLRVWRTALVDFGALERAALQWCAEANSIAGGIRRGRSIPRKSSKGA
jgi:hypothetical protein